MIQTKTPINYGDRNERTGQIRLEACPQEMKKDSQDYLVIDWDNADSENAWKSKTVVYSSEKKNLVNAYIEANYDLSGLTYTEKEWFKIIVGLMLDTQTNLLENGKTIYQQDPPDWEYTPETLALFPMLITE